MLRRFPLVVLALALWFAAEPLVHSHPIRPSNGSSASVCAVCSTGMDQPIAAPTVTAPLRILAVVDDAPLAAVHPAAKLLLTSRAPPAA